MRFVLENNTFRIVKSYSYNEAYVAFCKNHVDPKLLVNKEAVIGNVVYVVISSSNHLMPVKDKFVERTYVTLAEKTGVNRQKRFYYQRLRRGFDSSEFWNLDQTILDFLLPRLKCFLKESEDINWFEENDIVPSQPIVQSMIDGFETLKKIKKSQDLTEEDLNKIKKDFDSFKRHFDDLWT